MRAAVFLAVAGNVGSGKTTLTTRLAARLGLHALPEPADDNPYLADFYADMRRWALPLQLRFLAARARQLEAAQRAGRGIVQDRTCYEDAEIFAAALHARGAMDARDWETYALVSSRLLATVEPPDLLVHLRRSPERCLAQIARRGRPYERGISLDYLVDLGQRYDAWFEAWSRGPKLLVQADGLELRDGHRDLEGVVERIVDAMPQRMLFDAPRLAVLHSER
ncbi:MAG: deoxynucleoside kinase [Myxococcota bacterium]|nr:deoxynucleoside kinase [Myxococcota bacterium]MDW8363793.1 deoxynucleoside kinase [Myxococcales bacterium]